MISMKKIIFLVLLISGYGISRVQGQATSSFNFSLGSKPVTGWINVAGDPSVAVRTASDGATGWTISSVATANWVPGNGNAANDGGGQAGGTFFPADVMLNYWYQDNPYVASYNALVPQLIISGLHVDSVYTVSMTGSLWYTPYDADPSRYTVAGAIVYGYIDVNADANIADGAVFHNIAPDASGQIKVYVNPVMGHQGAIINGIRIVEQRSITPAPVVSFIHPTNGEVLLEDNDFTISAAATETGGSITRVEFYANGTKIGEDSTSPYSMVWSNPDAAQYILTARAIDGLGIINTASINVSVEALSSFWSLTGNIRANADSNFLGTVDTNRLAIRTNNLERVSILGDGSVGIGTTNTQGYKLAVNGNAIFTKVRIKAYNAWPDYVFKKEYPLPGLDSLEKYIRLHQHLPGITPAEEVKTTGIDVADGQAALLKKVEELTLYLIKENKLLKECNKKLEKQQEEIDELKKQLLKGK